MFQIISTNACRQVVLASTAILFGLGLASQPANAGSCTTVAPGVFACSGTFSGTGIEVIETNSSSDINLTTDMATDVATTATNKHGVVVKSVGADGEDGRDASDVPAHSSEPGEPGNPSGNITVNSAASIEVHGSGAIGILGVAVAGKGGQGGDAAVGRNSKHGGPGGSNTSVNVSLENSGTITTHGTTGMGIVGQNHGGLGGKGGDGSFLGGGGSGAGGGGQAGGVAITNDGIIITNGDHAAGIFLHSVGGFGGEGGSDSGFVGYGGSGGSAGNGGTVTGTNTKSITTLGDYANGIYAQSVGGGGGRGGDGHGIVGLGAVGGFGGAGGTVQITNRAEDNNPDGAKIITTGKDAIAIFAQSVGGSGGDGGDSGGLVSVGGDGEHGGTGGNVTVDSAGTIVTSGTGGTAIHAQSIGGGGGHGGSSGGVVSIGGKGGSGGNAGLVTVDNSTEAVISTTGDDAAGIFAQSVGGGGGTGGSSVAVGPAVSVGIGGAGGDGGHGNTVTVYDCDRASSSGPCETATDGTINTAGDRSHGIHAQGVGGGGGRGGYAISASGGPFAFSAAVGGSGGGGGDGSTVDVNSNSNITTIGQHSSGISAESVGGGGGSGGFAIAGSISEDLSVSVGVGGHGGDGGHGGNVTLNALGDISTGGEVSHGLFAQSIGGGGGNGGFSVAGSISTGVSAAFAIGGRGGSGGHGDAVSLTSDGSVTTAGDLSNGIHAQSIGGGGGHGGFAIGGAATTGGAGLSFGLGGTGGDGGNANKVDLTSNGDVMTSGQGSHAVFAQSVGGGGGSGGFSGAFSMSLGDGADLGVAIGGSGGTASHGDEVTVIQNGKTTTTGADATGIVAQSIGGGGGHGGFGLSAALSTGSDPNLTAAIGGSGGAGGDGDKVTTTIDGIIMTDGSRAHGIHAQSIGGGGGTGGFSFSGDIATSSGSKNLALSIGGSGGTAGTSSDVDVTTTKSITTNGFSAIGAYAQSIGGGGGDGGMAISGALSGGSSRNATFSLGGTGGAGGTAGNITLDIDGIVTTAGEEAHGILGQSIGGGGGNGGLAVALDLTSSGNNTQINIGIGGDGGSGGDSGTVDISATGGVKTTEYSAIGVYAQSIGGGGGNGGGSSTYSVLGSAAGPEKDVQVGVSIGGKGGSSGAAAAVTVTTDETVSTQGDASHAIVAQSIGGGGGRGGNANSFSFFTPGGDTKDEDGEDINGKKNNLNLNLSVGGEGGSGNHGGTVDVTNLGTIQTTGTDSYGIFAQSIGGGGGEGGHASHSSFVNLPIFGETLPPGLNKINIYKNLQISVGGSGGGSGDGNTVTIKSGDRKTNTAANISTQGEGSFGVFAQSIGGGGGIGGYGAIGLTGAVGVGGSGAAAGNGAKVNVDILGNITTRGDVAYGILAQSIGGGGGISGNVKRGFKNFGIGIGVGGGGGGGGNGGDVTVTSEGTISTSGAAAHGIVAQSIGGGGGIGGDFGNGIGGAGSNGDIGNAGNVTVHHTGTIMTAGHDALAVFAQSNSAHGVGDIDVTVTSVITQGDEAHGIHTFSVGNHAGAHSVKVGNSPSGGLVMTLGDDSLGIRAVSEMTTTNSANIEILGNAEVHTAGQRATGVLAKSQGVGAGTVDVNIAGGSTSGDDANLIEAVSDGTTGAGQDVTVNTAGNLQTTGTRSTAIKASSTGVGAGDVVATFDGSITTTGKSSHGIDASSSGTGTGGTVNIEGKGDVIASGIDSDAFRLQADPGMQLTLDIEDGTIQGGSGDGVGVRLIDGGANELNNFGSLSALSGTAISATSGDDTVTNHGTITGNIDLGTGTNALFNTTGAHLKNNDVIALNGGTLTSAGSISPGGDGIAGVTKITGDFVQTESGAYLIDADYSPAASDLIEVSGTAVLDGKLIVNLQQLDMADPITILKTDGGATLNGLSVDDTLAVDYEIIRQGNDVLLAADYEFDVPGISLDRNQGIVTKYLDAILAAGGDAAFSPLLVELAKITDPEEYKAAVQAINPEAHFGGIESTFNLTNVFPETLLSCRQADTAYSPISEGQCLWARVERSTAHQRGGTNSVEYSETSSDFAGGVQFKINDTWRMGLSVGHGTSSAKSENRFQNSGQTTSGGIAVKYVTGPTLFAMTLTGGYAQYNGIRDVVVGEFARQALSETEIAYGAIRLRAAHVFESGNFYAKPIFDVDITRLDLMKLRETGGGIVSVEADDARQTLVAYKPAIEFGATFRARATTEVRPYIGLGATFRPTSDLDLSLRFAGAQDTVAPFVLESTLDTVIGNLTAGVDVVDDTVGALSLRYDGLYSDNRREHTGSVKFSVNF